MAGRYSRIDNRKSSGNGSVITLVVFTALCMVGIWMMTSSTLIPVQDSKVSENNNGVEIEGTVNNVESNSNDGDASEVENSNIAAGENSAPRDEGKQQQFDDSQGDAREVENSNVAVEDNNAPRDEGKQKQFNDSQGDLPEDAIIVDNNERSNQGEKNGDRPEEMEKKVPAEKSDDKENINGEENKQEGSQGVSDNGEDKKVDSEPQAVDSQVSEPGETIQNNVEGSEQKSDQNIGKTDVDKQGDQIMPVKVPHKTVGEKVENKVDDNEKRPEENSDNKVIDKQHDRVAEKVGNKKDDGEKRAEEAQGNADVRTKDDRIDEKMEKKKDNNEKTEENSGKPVEEEQEDRVEEKVVNKNDSEKKSLETIDKSDVEKKENPAEHVENNKVEEEKQSDENSSQTNLDAKLDETVEKKKNEEKKDKQPQQGSVEEKDNQNELLPSGAQSELLKETITQNGSFSTQAAVSENEKEAQKSSVPQNQNNYGWKICKTYTGPDYIPCLDNLAALKKLRTTKHYEHRERHCPENPPTCLVPIHQEYKRPIEWPTSREKIWYHNVPHTKLAEFKGHQNWVKVSGEFLIFPGGGTQFMNGALHYIDYIQQSVPDISWGKRSRVVLDVGCGVASFGGFLFDRDVLTMSMAPKDEHEAQVQFALERGIPAICAVMGTRRLPYPARVFDVVHCARCRVPWHIEGGKLLLELNRLLRPGGIFMWSATPVYQKLPEDIQIWEEMKKLTKAMCWEVVSIINDKMNGVGIAVFRKANTNDCYKKRAENSPPLCPDTNDANASWNVPLEACMHKIPVAPSERGSKWPEEWPARVEKAPYWLSATEVGVYGKPAAEDFAMDYKHWKRVVTDTYLNGLGIKWSAVRNVMDMRAVYGGLAAALRKLNVWVLNVVSIDGPDTLPIIFDRGLFGIYHNWCESFNTYPRTYDLLHADHLFSEIKKKCNIMAMVAETDRILRPEGRIIVRDTTETITELESIFKSLQWDVRIIYSKNMQGVIVAQKSMWRPTKEEILTYATV